MFAWSTNFLHSMQKSASSVYRPIAMHCIHVSKIWSNHQVATLVLHCIGSKVGHQVAKRALSHCIGLPYWHYQLVSSSARITLLNLGPINIFWKLKLVFFVYWLSVNPVLKDTLRWEPADTKCIQLLSLEYNQNSTIWSTQNKKKLESTQNSPI